MEKMIVTEYGRPIMMQKVKEFTQRTMFLADERVIPYAVFALLDSGELVNISNFDDMDTAEIAQIILDIFTENKKTVFDVNLEVFGIKKFLEMLRYVSADSETLKLSITLDTLTARILKLSSDSQSGIEPTPFYSRGNPADCRADSAVTPVAHKISPGHRF